VSRWDRWGWYKAPPKRPPPKQGIKVKKTGATWWGQRWLAALEQMSDYSSRLKRGRSYARAGRTHDLAIKPGEVTAKVTGSRATPYKVRVTLEVLGETVWRKAIAAMARKSQFAAELLAGEMPRDIDNAFEEAGASLFPAKPADLETACSCPDWANPCKHVAATHYVLGEAFDRDPFLLFELRGRTKMQVLDALRAARSGDPRATAELSVATRKGRNKRARESGQDHEDVNPSSRVSLKGIAPADYDKAREPLPALNLSFEAPPVSGALLRQFGKPATWSCAEAPAELLGPMIHQAAERARRLALAEAATVPQHDTDAAAAGARSRGQRATRERPREG